MPVPPAAASSAASAPAHLLFVYGSLKRGEHNRHHLGSAATCLGPARTVPGYRLFNLGTYPGMVPAADDFAGVTGEVWSIPVAQLPHLDAFEGVPEQLYRRAPIHLQPPFADQPVETYLYARDTAAFPALGDTWTGR